MMCSCMMPFTIHMKETLSPPKMPSKIMRESKCLFEPIPLYKFLRRESGTNTGYTIFTYYFVTTEYILFITVTFPLKFCAENFAGLDFALCKRSNLSLDLSGQLIKTPTSSHKNLNQETILATTLPSNFNHLS